MKIKFLSLLLVVFAFSCNSTKTSTTHSEMIESGKYEVTKLNGKDVSDKYLSLNIDLNENRISGYGGCNNFSGELKSDAKTLEASKVISTMRHCEDSHEVESVFLKGLSEKNSYVLKNDILTIKDKDGKVIIEAKQVPHELKDGTYKVISIGGKSVEKDHKADMMIDTANKTFSGSTGCNSFGSSYKITEEGNLELGMSRVTKMYCEGKMEFEADFLKKLGQVHSFDYQRNTLHLRSEDGKSLFVAELTETKK